MVILGALVNGVAALVGGLIGMGLGRFVDEELSDFLMLAMGLSVSLTGLTGMVGAQNILLTTICMCAGGLIGHLVDIDAAVKRLGDWIQAQFDKHVTGNSAFANVSRGFVSASLVICIGAMAIVGSLEAGLVGDHSTLFTKALMDLVICVLMGTSLGVGVCVSGVAVFVYEAILSLGAHWLAPLLSDAVIAEMLVCGSLILFGMGFNFMKISDFKVANLLPAVFLPIALVPLMGVLPF
jgi:uncharacterized membrane protein YqgA involved in biofilm formation